MPLRAGKRPCWRAKEGGLRITFNSGHRHRLLQLLTRPLRAADRDFIVQQFCRNPDTPLQRGSGRGHRYHRQHRTSSCTNQYVAARRPATANFSMYPL